MCYQVTFKNNFLLNWQPVQVFRGLADLLFNLYINELLWSMTTDFSDPLFLPDGTKLNCLLYADDLVLLTKSKQGLEHCLALYPHFVRSG